jgi:hypothetical protein
MTVLQAKPNPPNPQTTRKPEALSAMTSRTWAKTTIKKMQSCGQGNFLVRFLGEAALGAAFGLSVICNYINP